MAMTLFPTPDQQFSDANGKPYSGGKLYFYEPATTTPKDVYSDSTGVTVLSNPVILDSAGRASVWLDGYYRVVLTDSLDNQVWSVDNVSSAAFTSSSSLTANEWISETGVLVYLSSTQFTISGDQTSEFEVGRRIKAIVSSGTIYGTISNSSEGGNPVLTTVTVVWDNTGLDSGLTAVSLGLITATYTALPLAFQVPIGSILPWYKSLTGVPALPYGWVECNGQTLSDVHSPLNGQVIPNLNGNASGADTFSNSKTAVYLRGGANSGNYTPDAIAAHTHVAGNITVNAHTHSIAASGNSTAAATQAAHSHTVDYYAGGAGSNYSWNTGTSVLGNVPTSSATPAITLTGHTDLANANGTTGNTGNNSNATETIPKTVTVVYILRVK
jgi:hypothetical protein